MLVKQELVEVKNNVTKRVEFIKNDISRLEGTIKGFPPSCVRIYSLLLSTMS